MLKFILLMISILLLNFNGTCFAIDEQISDNIQRNESECEEKITQESLRGVINNYGENRLTYVLFSICSDASNEYSEGNNNIQDYFGHHSWIAITNVGMCPININGIEVPIFSTITIGSWQGIKHNGVYYNIEKYYYEKGEFSELESSYKTILLNDFKLNYFISLLADEKNDTWSVTNNCATFAERIWNKVSETRISAGIIKCPLKLYENILNLGGKKGLIMASAKMNLYYGGKNPKKFEL